MRVHQANRGRDGEKGFRYSIRKYHFGAASVAVAALLFLGNGSVSAQSPSLAGVGSTRKQEARAIPQTQGYTYAIAPFYPGMIWNNIFLNLYLFNLFKKSEKNKEDFPSHFLGNSV